MAGVQSEVLRAVVNATTVGNNTLVAAVTGKRIRVMSFVGVATAAATVAFQSGAGGTALTGTMALAANGQINLPYNPSGHCETAAGALLNLSMGVTGPVTGVLTYKEVD